MIERKGDALVFSFPEVHKDARCVVVFQRTLRLPEERRKCPMPPGLGRYPLLSAHELGGALPRHWHRDGYVIPMFRSEALQIVFIGSYPCAIMVTCNGRNAITGRETGDDRLWRPQDYVTFPRHPWVEWFCYGGEKTRQFTAGSAGGGETITPAAGLRVTLHPMTGEGFEKYRASRASFISEACVVSPAEGRSESGLDDRWLKGAAWDVTAERTCTVYPLTPRMFRLVTGRHPDGNPPVKEDYDKAGIPWSDWYGAEGAKTPVATNAAFG